MTRVLHPKRDIDREKGKERERERGEIKGDRKKTLKHIM